MADNIELNLYFKTGYIRPVGRGIVLGDLAEGKYLDELIEEAVIAQDAYSYGSGSELEDINITIKIGKAHKS